MANESIVLKSVSAQPNLARITYVLDTSVLLADPVALTRFAEHEVIIPITVIGELETKRDHPDLGYFARAALRTLDDLRVKSGRLDHPISINDVGGSLSVELNHSDVYGELDSPEVVYSARERKNIGRTKSKYRQIKLDNEGHLYLNDSGLLVKRIYSWVNRVISNKSQELPRICSSKD